MKAFQINHTPRIRKITQNTLETLNTPPPKRVTKYFTKTAEVENDVFDDILSGSFLIGTTLRYRAPKEKNN